MQTNIPAPDNRIGSYIEAVERLKDGDYRLDLSAAPSDDLGCLGQALQELAHALELRRREFQKLDQITTDINTGFLLDEVLEKIYCESREIIPYNRIGLSLIVDGGQRARARWAKSDQPRLYIKDGYSALLAGSSLQTILETGRPRILNNLVEYLAARPESKSTRLIVAEGIRSSLTCPLTVEGAPVGFIYFSSILPNTYTHVHVDTFIKIASRLSVMVGKSNLVSEMAAQKATIERQHAELLQLYSLQEEYLREVGQVTEAAAEVESGTFDPPSLDQVAARSDALGSLARVFQTMARQVYLREESLKQQVKELRFVIDETNRTSQVSEITKTEYFQKLKNMARELHARTRNNQDDSSPN